jgi:hypothetical protein
MWTFVFFQSTYQTYELGNKRSIYEKVAWNEFRRCAIGKNGNEISTASVLVKINPASPPDICAQIGEIFRNSHRKSTQTPEFSWHSIIFHVGPITYGISDKVASRFFRFLTRPPGPADLRSVKHASCVEDYVDFTHFLYTTGDGATLPSVPRLFASPTDRLTADKMGFCEFAECVIRTAGMRMLPYHHPMHHACTARAGQLVSGGVVVWHDAQKPTEK